MNEKQFNIIVRTLEGFAGSYHTISINDIERSKTAQSAHEFVDHLNASAEEKDSYYKFFDKLAEIGFRPILECNRCKNLVEHVYQAPQESYPIGTIPFIHLYSNDGCDAGNAIQIASRK